MPRSKASFSRTDERTGEPGSGQDGGAIDQAFDRWLTQGLHLLFDPVVAESLPDDLVGLIEADRAAAGGNR